MGGVLFMRLGRWLTGGWATMGFGFRPDGFIEDAAGSCGELRSSASSADMSRWRQRNC